MHGSLMFYLSKEERRKKWAAASKTDAFDKNSNTNRKKEDIANKENLICWKKLDKCAEPETTTDSQLAASNVPLILLTVNTPVYRARCQETIQHLDQWQRNCRCIIEHRQDRCQAIQIDSCDMLNLEEHPTMGAKKIVFQGWRTVLLPKVLQDYSKQPIHFVFAAEDDIRIPDAISPCEMVRICQEALQSYPSIDILSLGHSWKAVQKTEKRTVRDDMNSNLLYYLQEAKGAGVHGATLFAIRFPQGIAKLQEALDRAAADGKQTHFDQFLFYSPYHDLKIALCDPPLVGWAEVDTTLTKSSSGYRRKGGGRLGFMPNASQGHIEELTWIQRELLEKGEST